MQLSACDQWLKTLYGSIGFEDYTLLDRSARTLLGNIIKAEGDKKLPWHPWRGITPSHVFFRGLWNWDTAFHAVGVSHWDAELAREQIQMFLSLQSPEGVLPDVLSEDGRIIDTYGKPPVMPWAAMIVNQRHPDLEFIRTVYEPFTKYEQHWRRNRGGDQDGLFHYDCSDTDPELRLRRARYETGWDNAVRWDQEIYKLWPIDLNCYMVMLYRAMVYFADELGLKADSIMWKKKESELVENVESKLWDKSRGMYLDYDFGRGEFIEVLSPASFMPLFIQTASEERAALMAAIAQDTKKFTPGWPTVAYDHPEFDPKGYWRGRTWLNVAYFALKGLKNYGFVTIADMGRNTLLGWVCQEPSTIYENYHPQTGSPLGAPYFGWSSVFVIEFIMNWS